MVAGPDGFGGLVQGVAGGETAERDQGLLADFAEEFGAAGFIEEFGGGVEAGG